MVTTANLGVSVPAELENVILSKAFEASVVGQLSGNTPIPLSGSVVPVYDGGIEAGLVAEGAAKPSSNFSATPKTITPAKLAVITVVSKELIDADPAGVLAVVQADLVNSIARGIDSLVLHGVDRRGNAYSGTNVSVIGDGNQTVELTGAETTEEYAAALAEAYSLAADASDPTGWAFDSRLRAKNAAAISTGAGLADLAAGATSVAGLPAAYGRSVAVDGTRAVVGDWSKVRFGFAKGIEVTRSTEATIGGVSMFESNQVALLVEARIGWTTLDRAAFSVVSDEDEEDEGGDN